MHAGHSEGGLHGRVWEGDVTPPGRKCESYKGL